MGKFLMLFFLATVPSPIITAAKKDQFAESNKNINLYLVPPPGLKSFLPEYKETVNREPRVYSRYDVEQDPEDKNIAIKIVSDAQKSFVVKPSYNSDSIYDALSSRQSQPKLELKNSEDPSIKYALEPEGPNQTKVTVKVIKEHKKTFAVDPSYIENRPDAPEFENSEFIYKNVGTEYPKSESVYQNSNPEYTKYELKAEEPKEKNLFVKVVEEEKKTFVADPRYKNDNTYYEPKRRKIETIYEKSEPEYNIAEYVYNKYGIKEEEPKHNNVLVKVVKEDTNSFDLHPKYESDNTYFEQKFRRSEPEYENSEADYNRYEVKKEKPKLFVKVVKQDEKTFTVDPKYKNNNSYLEPVYQKSVTEYRKSEPQFRQSEQKYADDEERQVKEKVFVKVVNEDKKSFNTKYDYDDTHLEPVYKKSVTEYRKSEPQYRQSEHKYDKLEDNENENKEEQVIGKVVKKDKKTFAVDSKYKNDNKYVEPEYRTTESHYNKHEKSKPRENDVYVKVDKQPSVLRYLNDNKYFEPDYSKSITEYEKSEPEYGKSVTEYKTSEPEYRTLESDHNKHEVREDEPTEKEVSVADSIYKSDNAYDESEYTKSEPEENQSESDYEKHDENQEKSKEKKLFVKAVKEDKETLDDDPRYKSDDRYFEPKRKYEESEQKSNIDSKFSEPEHDVLVKIWTNKSK